MTQPTQTSSRRTLWMVLGAVVAVVIVAAIVTAVLVSGSDDSSADPDDPVGTTEPATPPEEPPVDEQSEQPAELAGEARFVEVEGEPLPLYESGGPDPAIGMRPPLLAVEDVAGSVYTISPDVDGAIMVVFLAHWCPACNDEVPHLAELERDGRIPDDVEVFGILTGMDPSRPNFPPSRWAADLGWPWPAAGDGIDFTADPAQWAAASAYGLTGYPYVVMIDDGVVVDRWTGGLGTDGLEARIAAAVG